MDVRLLSKNGYNSELAVPYNTITAGSKMFFFLFGSDGLKQGLKDRIDPVGCISNSRGCVADGLAKRYA